MGAEHGIYVGAYVWCSNVPREFKVHETGCPTGQPVCPKSNGVVGQFCSTCGAKLVSKPIKVKRKPVDANQVEDEFQGTLRVFGRHTSDAFEDFDVFTPNRNWKGQPDREIDEHFAGQVEIADSTPGAERRAFASAFERELGHLRASYGESNVEVRWGVLGEWF